MSGLCCFQFLLAVCLGKSQRLASQALVFSCKLFHTIVPALRDGCEIKCLVLVKIIYNLYQQYKYRSCHVARFYNKSGVFF